MKVVGQPVELIQPGTHRILEIDPPESVGEKGVIVEILRGPAGLGSWPVKRYIVELDRGGKVEVFANQVYFLESWVLNIFAT